MAKETNLETITQNLISMKNSLVSTGKSALGVGIISLGLLSFGCDTERSTRDTKSSTISIDKDERVRRTLLSYLSQPRFSSKDFAEQITGTKAELELYDMNEEMLYFSIFSKQYNKESTLSNITNNSANVEFGQLSDGNRLSLGGYLFPNKNSYVFRFPASEFKVDRQRKISIDFRTADYNLNMEELVDFMENKSIYGGKLNAEIGKNMHGYEVIANHGALVGIKGEPSLSRLVSNLTHEGQTKEQKAQSLLDFVTKEIKYDGKTRIYSSELLKRPNEILMTKEADCSGKTILYSSLLEQLGIDHRLTYFDGHIAVAVEGDFSDLNNMDFNLGKKKFSIAETTAKGFRIGESILRSPQTINDLKYLQKPGEDSKLYHAHTGKDLKFI